MIIPKKLKFSGLIPVEENWGIPAIYTHYNNLHPVVWSIFLLHGLQKSNIVQASKSEECLQVISSNDQVNMLPLTTTLLKKASDW